MPKTENPPEIKKHPPLEPLLPQHGKTNYAETLMHLFKGNIGVGLFAMGDAFKNGGIYVATILTIVFAVICVHCQHLLLYSAKTAADLHKDGEEHADYAEALELCFSEGPRQFAFLSVTMGKVCNYFIAFTQLGFCCIYLVFIAVNVQEILASHDVHIELRLLIVIIWVPIWLCCLITQLKSLVFVSLIANVTILAGFLIVMYFALKDGLPGFNERVPYTDLHFTSLSIGTIIFSYEGIALVLPIRNAMKNPDNFAKTFGVLNVGMGLVVLLYMMGGLFGYWKWGEDVGDTTTSNLGTSIFAQCTKGLVALAILLTYPLQFFVPMATMVPYVLRKCNCVKNNLFCELIFRTLICASTLAIAVAFPDVSVFISLLGGLCSTVLALCFPPIMESLLLMQTDRKPKWLYDLKMIKNIFILIVGIFIIGVVTYSSVLEIIKFFEKPTKLIL